MINNPPMQEKFSKQRKKEILNFLMEISHHEIEVYKQDEVYISLYSDNKFYLGGKLLKTSTPIILIKLQIPDELYIFKKKLKELKQSSQDKNKVSLLGVLLNKEMTEIYLIFNKEKYDCSELSSIFSQLPVTERMLIFREIFAIYHEINKQPSFNAFINNPLFFFLKEKEKRKFYVKFLDLGDLINPESRIFFNESMTNYKDYYNQQLNKFQDFVYKCYNLKLSSEIANSKYLASFYVFSYANFLRNLLEEKPDRNSDLLFECNLTYGYPLVVKTFITVFSGYDFFKTLTDDIDVMNYAWDHFNRYLTDKAKQPENKKINQSTVLNEKTFKEENIDKITLFNFLKNKRMAPCIDYKRPSLPTSSPFVEVIDLTDASKSQKEVIYMSLKKDLVNKKSLYNKPISISLLHDDGESSKFSNLKKKTLEDEKIQARNFLFMNKHFYQVYDQYEYKFNDYHNNHIPNNKLPRPKLKPSEYPSINRLGMTEQHRVNININLNNVVINNINSNQNFEQPIYDLLSESRIMKKLVWKRAYLHYDEKLCETILDDFIRIVKSKWPYDYADKYYDDMVLKFLAQCGYDEWTTLEHINKCSIDFKIFCQGN
jgi:hypothetical protein